MNVFIFLLFTIIHGAPLKAEGVIFTDCEFNLSTNFSPEQEFILQSDLRYLKKLRGGKSSDLHLNFFKSEKVLGASYCQYLRERIKKLHYIEKPRISYIAANPSHLGEIAVTDLYFMQSRVTRLATLIHEARHTMDESTQHRACPSAGNTPYPVIACDSDINGAYGYELVWYSAVVLHCQNCSLEDRKEALRGAKLSLERITGPISFYKLY